MDTVQIESLTSLVLENVKAEEEISVQIKAEYQCITEKFQDAKYTVTKEIEEHYKNIERLFRVKQEHIVRQNNAKTAINKLLGIA